MLKQFIETYKGNVDVKFWNNIFDDFKEYESGGGLFIRGWILSFFPYGKGNKNFILERKSKEEHVRIDSISSYFANVPFVLELVDGLSHNMKFIAGFSGVSKIGNNTYKAQVSAAVAFADEEANKNNKKYREMSNLEYIKAKLDI